ncbi:hypothetical protein KC345_g6828 [Hortaea werneckii]|nr:hypothetical protein KC345_g6828 [Hortaea werneckii]
MAHTPSTGVASPSHAAEGSGVPAAGLPENPYGVSSFSSHHSEMVSPAFQAVNASAVAQNASNSTPPADLATQRASGSPVVASGESQSTRAARNAQPSPNMDGLDAATSDAATYGTRSRNRTGNARPNYAEDQDMDFEYSSAATTKKKNPGAQPSNAANVDDLRGSDDRARSVGTSSNAAKESTPGTPAPPAAPTSKKRKAGPVPQQAQTPPVASASASTGNRKPTTMGNSAMARETNMLTFTKHRHRLNKKGELIADDGSKLSVNDHVYLVCEPPGDPYYLCRIMEFLHVDATDPTSPIDSIRVNWYYRPRDVQRFNSDSRLVYGTMHSDMCPITSLRGKCTIKHKSEISDLDAYRKERDSFYFIQVFDRFIRRWYECIPVAQIINVPDKVKKALDERWKFIVVEIGRVKELTSAVKTCKRCAKYCASQDSVDCAICKNSYHMNCVQPPLPKKPSRGFAWACGPCSRASERALEARNTPTVSGDVTEAEEEVQEEEVPAVSNDSTRAPSPSGEEPAMDMHPATQAEIAMAKMWPMRYLGIHCRVEDALQYDDRAIYPRASSRLGPRHQANVTIWPGRPVELVKPAEIKKRYSKNNSSHKKDGKLSKETVAALEADREERSKRPKWVQDEPPGYVARGEDFPEDDPRCTAKLVFKMPEETPKPEADKHVDEYVKEAKRLARGIGVPPFGVNFLDKALELFAKSNYNVGVALQKLRQIDRKKDLHEPVLTKDQLGKFEEGVAKYGSEHRLIRLHMKTNLPNSDIVRFYYLWKKTPKGREIWGNYGGRKGSKRKVENDAGAKLQLEVAHNADDSAFDNDKAIRKQKGFQCKFCSTTHSRQWRKAPGVAPGQLAPPDGKGSSKQVRPLLALCLRCAGLWRKYAIQWEDVDELAKKVSSGGGRALKKRIDEELLRELMIANEAANTPPLPGPEPTPALPSVEAFGEPPKKKSKMDAAPAVLPPEPPKKKEKPPPPPKEPTPPPPPIVPSQPQWRVLPCAICRAPDDTIECAHCKLTVHRRCFGLDEKEGLRPDGSVDWICEQCQNDRHPEVSTDYACCLCLTEETLTDLVEPPKVSHKKKTDREREKERMEKELTEAMRAEYRSKQISMHRPPLPREPLKRTTGNNWVHVYCAVWTPEIRFSNAQKMEVAEGFQLIPPARYEAVCKLCKNKDHLNKVREDAGACVSCFQCGANFHASCAFEAGYQFGFDVTPVKGSRKDQVVTARLGEENGAVTAGIWCKEHAVKSIIHPLNEVVDESGKNALQVFVETYKQADLTLTGTVRKAAQAQLTKDKGQQAAPAVVNGSRRESTANSSSTGMRRGARASIANERSSAAAELKADAENGATAVSDGAETTTERRCAKCNIDVTPRWHRFIREAPKTKASPEPPRRMSMTLAEIADLERERRRKATASTSAEANDTNGSIENATLPQLEQSRSQQSNGEPKTSETAMAESNGELKLDGGKHDSDEVFHNHALPRYQNPAAMRSSPKPEEGNTENGTIKEQREEWLCHKCFVKKKIHPTPSPPPQPPQSPPRPFPMQVDWSHPPAGQPQNQPPAPPSEPVRMPWDHQPRPNQPPPPQSNAVGPAPPTFGSIPPSHGSGYPPYGSQPNFYGPSTTQPSGPPQHHAPPPPQPYGPPHPQSQGPPQGPPHGPPHMHSRQPSFGYGPPPASNPPSYGAPRPPHMQSFVPQMPHAMNGTASPFNGRPPIQSPTFPGGPPPPPHHQPFTPNRTESPFANQLAPIGQPLHSNSPSAAFPRPVEQHMNGQPNQAPAHQQPSLAQPPPGPQPPHGPMNQQQPGQHANNNHQFPQGSTPQLQHTSTLQPPPPSRPESQSHQPPHPPPPGPPHLQQQQQSQHPSTPPPGQPGGPPPSYPGASASPNLRNLLH